MSTAEVRDALERTGVLLTQHEDDLGHIPDFWRSTVLGLCEALESAPLDAVARLRTEEVAHKATGASLAASQAESDRLRGVIEQTQAEVLTAKEAGQSARRLVEEAASRMRTLNNAMSVGWLERASALLGE